MTTRTEARDDLYALVTEAWGTRGPIDYEDKPRSSNDEPIPPKDAVPWLRCKFTNTFSRARSIGNIDGVRRYERTGIFQVQVNDPLGTSLIQPEESARIVTNALEGVPTPHGLILRNVRAIENGSDGHWYVTEVIADVSYDEVR
jgi:hypothetical protein